ncbi:MAG: tRNA lysidine(34) synthetase TilS [Kiritimatiellae bacterium]|jgi:tRNA(Ile)-lysidine synthase|nr:tRNA lysidine(34) synthetase TilS [Kiritimatiellia bacterium]
MKKQATDVYIKSADEIEAVVQDFIEQYLGLGSIKRLGIAVSSGADSIALFHLLLPICKERGITPVVMHLNHGLRAESEEEALFVTELAKSNGLLLATETIDLRNRKPNNQSLEMSARNARLRFYGDCMQSCKLDALATGHHANDVCETLLLRLARGSGIAGMSGMRPVTLLKVGDNQETSITILRPLLNIASRALREWLKSRELTWHDDLSNLDTSIPRNNIRHIVLPFLRDNLSSEIDSRLCHSAATLREDDAFLNELAGEKLNAIRYDKSLLVPALLKLPLAIRRRILRLWFFEQDLAAAAGFRSINDLLLQCETADSNWRFQLAENVIAKLNNNLLSLINPQTHEMLPEVEIAPDETILWGDFDIRIERSQGIEAQSQGVGFFPSSCSLDAKKLKGKKLIVRQRQTGDRINPTGLKGSKKVKDIFIDAKIPQEERDAIPIIACGDDVLWIPGYRISRDYALSDDKAESIHITVSKSL